MGSESIWSDDSSSTGRPRATFTATRSDVDHESHVQWLTADMPRWTVWRSLPRRWQHPVDVFISLSDVTRNTFFDTGILSSFVPATSLRCVIQEDYPLSAPGVHFDVNLVTGTPTLYRKDLRASFLDLTDSQLEALDRHFARVQPLVGERKAHRRAELERASRFFRAE